MFGLMLKDLLLVRREKMAYIVLALAFVVYPVMSGSPAFAMLIGMMPAYWLVSWASAYDFKYKADAFVNSGPCSRASVVGARFLLPVVVQAASAALALAGWLVIGAFAPVPASPPYGFMAATFAVSMIMNSGYLATYYAFGYQRSRWVLILAFGLVFALASIVGGFDQAASGVAAAGAAGSGWNARLMFGQAPVGAYLALLGAAAALYAAFFAVAYLAYRRKEF